MKNFYDKLILLVAVLILVGGVMLYVKKSGEAPDPSAPVRVQPADNPYSPVPAPETSTSEAAWPEPREQSSTWVYDVFTPPKIYIDEAGQFTAEGWIPPEPKEPFGLYLAEIKRDLYRIQIQGYIEEDRDDPSKSLVLLFDVERDATVRLRAGDKSDASEVEVVDFDINRQINADQGEVEVTARATIRDLRSDETVILTQGVPLYESGVDVTLRSEQIPTLEIELAEPGATFETELGEYKLLAINLEERSVTVEKLASGEEEESEIEELTLQTDTPENPSDGPEISRPTSTPPNNDFPF